ncbi:MAG TPA: T9SS type A sorting domain-containing protein [Ferruginibacter sp.]|nr:T9SS type A sorting domain-containing protein [Ferruginibacter sp.]
MKKILFIIILYIFSVSTVTAQIIQGTLLQGSAQNSVIFTLRSSAAFSNQITNVQFVLQIPNTATPIPTVQIKNNFLSAYIPAYNFNIVNSATPIAFSNENGYYNYLFSATTVGSPVYNFTTTAFSALEVEILGGPPTTPSTVRFACLPNGGASGQHNFYVETNTGDHTNEATMFYGAGANNGGSYSAYSFMPLLGILLPIKWLSFDAIKQGNNALLNWSVANENANHHYELLRSSDGINYTNIGIVNKSTTGSTTYNYTDIGINNLNATILYYRIKQVDIDGKSGYSDIRFITIDKKVNTAITVFPNPVTEGFYVSIPFENRDNSIVKLNLISANGQFIGSKEITTLQASNYYFNIKDRALASGDYFLQIIYEEKIMETKKITINR